MISQSKEFVKVFVKGFLGYADFLSDFSAKCGVNMLYRTESAPFCAWKYYGTNRRAAGLYVPPKGNTHRNATKEAQTRRAGLYVQCH